MRSRSATSEDCTPRLRDCRHDGADGSGARFAPYVFDSADGLTLSMKTLRRQDAAWPTPTVAFAVQPDARSTFAGGGSSRPAISPPFATAGVEVRNTGATSVGPGYLWTLRRVYPLLGQTLPERQVYDLLAGVAVLKQDKATGPVALFGQGHTAPLRCAALLDPTITEVILANPPESHRPDDAGIPRHSPCRRLARITWRCSIRPITFVGKMPAAYGVDAQVYEQLGEESHRVIANTRAWKPWASTDETTTNELSQFKGEGHIFLHEKRERIVCRGHQTK